MFQRLSISVLCTLRYPVYIKFVQKKKEKKDRRVPSIIYLIYFSECIRDGIDCCGIYICI